MLATLKTKKENYGLSFCEKQMKYLSFKLSIYILLIYYYLVDNLKYVTLYLVSLLIYLSNANNYQLKSSFRIE